MNTAHAEAVEGIATQVTDFYKQGQPFRIFHGSTNSTRIQSFKRNETIDVSKFNHVLSIDAQKQIAIVEPNVSMDQLVRETLKFGLIPPVVMELPSITVGGGIQGGAGESSSYEWGCFNEVCNWYEMVLGDGRVIKVSPQNNSDLFYGTAGSYGSLGVLTAAEVRLVPAKSYVRLSYIRIDSFESAVTTLTDLADSEDYDYLDGIMFASNRGVVMVGNLTDKIEGSVQRFSRSYDDWFYLHANKVMDQRSVYSETIPLQDYLFRYDRGAFWTGQYTFERASLPFNRLTRWLLNPMLNAQKLYQALQETNAAQQYVVQDLAVPRKNSVQFMKFIDKTFGQYPLWLCPLKPDTNSPLLCSHLDTDLVINVGVWLGQQFESSEQFVAVNRKVENKLTELGGKKWFYAQSYYPEDEFWKIYKKAWYEDLRVRYNATTLPSVYDKVISKNTPVKSIKKAAFKTLFGLARLKIRD